MPSFLLSASRLCVVFVLLHTLYDCGVDISEQIPPGQTGGIVDF